MARNCKGTVMFAALLLIAAAPAEPPPTYGAWLMCVTRQAERLAVATPEPLDAVALAALGRCQRERDGYRGALIAQSPALAASSEGRERIDSFMDRASADMLALAAVAAFEARYPGI